MLSKDHFVFDIYDSDINRNISFRPASLEEDVERLHHWHQQSHVIPFWKQNFTFLKYREHLQKLLADRHQTLYIGHLNGEAMSYWESYWAKDDIIAGQYETEAGDQGIHLLFGPQEFLGKGYALPLLRAMTALQFQHQGTNKVVTEPDIRNEKMIHIFKKCGFEPQKEIELPDKRALLMFCHRDTFLERWMDVDYIQDLHRSEQHV